LSETDFFSFPLTNTGMLIVGRHTNPSGHRRAPRVLVTLFPGLLLLGTVVGCNTQQDAAFVYRDAVDDIPSDKAQQELKDFLRTFYGDAAFPRHMLPEEEAEIVADQPIPTVSFVDRKRLNHGQRVYIRNCAPCHGHTGDGNGPAAQYLDPKPRDYRRGIFKFTSTPRGYKPRRADLVRIVRYGAKGTSMPAFRWLRDEDLQPLIDYVVLLSQRGELEEDLLYYAETELDEEDDPETTDIEEDSFYKEDVAYMVSDLSEEWNSAAEQIVLPTTRRPEYSDESILLGREAFLKQGCAKCHGNDGRGHTQGNVGKDDWGNVTFAADLTSGMLHGGRRPIDVYRRIYSGINGTPMPGFGDALADQPDTIWHMVNYILSIVEGRDVPGLEDIQPPPPAVAGEDVSEEATGDDVPADGAEPATDEQAEPSAEATDTTTEDAEAVEESDEMVEEPTEEVEEPTEDPEEPVEAVEEEAGDTPPEQPEVTEEDVAPEEPSPTESPAEEETPAGDSPTDNGTPSTEEQPVSTAD
jgi:mono/diheme cytochrome c family protein